MTALETLLRFWGWGWGWGLGHNAGLFFEKVSEATSSSDGTSLDPTSSLRKTLSQEISNPTTTDAREQVRPTPTTAPTRLWELRSTHMYYRQYHIFIIKPAAVLMFIIHMLSDVPRCRAYQQ
jgi:hypothetical protein